ncbi:MAG: hypothetical protein RL368_826 [Pseudomonadota bacterium]|jgi:inorganic pyrophosphatase
MALNNVSSGKNLPDDINVIIEIPAHGDPVKYEVDKESGALFVDRFMNTAMHYPCNYGYVPHTLSEDGDPVDVLVITSVPVISGAVIRCHPIGVLRMTDEAGVDAKVLAVPNEKLSALYGKIQSKDELPPIMLQQIAHFFEHYKDLDSNKWVKVDGWDDAEAAKKEILDGVARYNAAQEKPNF